MKFENVKNLSTAQFRRATGVKPKTFGAMVAIVGEAHKNNVTPQVP